MSYLIGDACASCGACAASCPFDAIKQEGGKYVITSDCAGCGSCVPACPFDAIASK